MSDTPRVHLDVCCYNRPFDDATQPRIWLEGQVVLMILDMVKNGHSVLLSSEMVAREISRISNPRRYRQVHAFTESASEIMPVGDSEAARGRELEGMGFRAPDALHIACAEAGRADVFLTTDDRVISRANRPGTALRVHVANPVDWFREVTTK